MEPSHEVMQRAGEFIWQNARLLDRRVFAFFFAGAPREAIIDAVRAYQNPDGGFGNALEPDIRCPDSQPVASVLALEALVCAGGDEVTTRRLCDYLLTVSTPEGGVPCILPSVMRYPRAPWWNAAANPPAGINPTADLAGLLYQLGCSHRWLDRAAQYCWEQIEGTTFTAPHDFLSIIRFLENTPEHDRAVKALEAIADQMLAAKVIEFDPCATGYMKGPLDWAPSPKGLCRRLFTDEMMALHLDALLARQQADGGWPLNWPTLSPANEMEWRGHVTVAALSVLTAYHKLP
ncbi:MAG: prenyltransferase/squalene oxidase repeat-containing protein [Mycobacterium leprae]